MTRPLWHARAAVFATFFAVGLGMGAWLVSIPAVQAATHVSHGVLGGLLLLLGLGGVLGMQLSGALSQRFGSRVVTIVFLLLFAGVVNLPLHAGGAVTLGLALLAFGLANGAVDVAMNEQAVLVERRYSRPVMSAFHALWSVGAAIGALAGSVIQQAQLTPAWTPVVATVGTLLALGFIAPRLIGAAAPTAAATGDRTATSPSAALPAATRRRGIGFGALAFLLMLAEGVANDWSALHAVEHLEVPRATAGLAYAVFAVSMTVGRLVVDRIAGRFGPAFVVRYGSALAAVGIVVVMISPLFAVTAVGWCLFGLGLAGVVPQLFTAAGNISPARQSIIMSRVVGAGYVGQLAGPAIIGAVAGLIGLNLSFVFPLVFCLLAVVIAGIVTPRRDGAEDAASPVLDPASRS